jgi:hypothetical protein
LLQLTVEDYVQTMEKLTTDMRFTVYNICYKRILVIWIVTAFVILLSLLFSGFQARYSRPAKLTICQLVNKCVFFNYRALSFLPAEWLG